MLRSGVIVCLLVLATSATPSIAATTTPYNADFTEERTVFQPCPPQVPQPALCFTGSDHSGLRDSSPPFPPDFNATEDFVGFIDLRTQSAVPGVCPPDPADPLKQPTAGLPDHNVVTIGTYAGQLFLTTDGIDCASIGHDHGVWHAHGGTGIFEGARGSGTVDTQATGGKGTPDEPIRSSSTYNGTLTFGD